MSDTLICPKCHERLWVGEIQIPLVTCPKCLSAVVNPNAAQETVEFSQVGATRQVVPLESQTSSDVRNTMRWLTVLAIALFMGAILTLNQLGMNLMMSGMFLLPAIIIALAIPVAYRNSRKFHQPPIPYYQRVQHGDVGVLEYSNIRNPGGVGSFIGGFMVAIGISFLTMMATGIAIQAGRPVSILALVGGVGWLIYLAIRNSGVAEKHSFFNGLITGIVCGALGCGPCAVGWVLS